MKADFLNRSAAAALLGLGLFGAAPASAQSQDPLLLGALNCGDANCKATRIVGRVNGDESRANPFVAVVGVGAGGCLRLDITAQKADLEMTVVGPDGSAYTDDDKHANPCPNCPRVVIGPLRKPGFYTVLISHWQGQSIEAGFNLWAGWYKSMGNPNCATTTAPADQR